MRINKDTLPKLTLKDLKIIGAICLMVLVVIISFGFIGKGCGGGEEDSSKAETGAGNDTMNNEHRDNKDKLHISSTDAGGKEGNLEDMTRDAPLIFRGKISKIEYKNSEKGGQNEPELPNTFVTYDVKKIFKGRVKGKKITLRFLGGVDYDKNGKPDSILRISGFPQFDIGDDDILHIRNNTSSICPLVVCALGRMRIINKKMYSEKGNPISTDESGKLILYPPEDLEEINTYAILDRKYKLVSKNSGKLSSIDRGKIQRFDAFSKAGLESVEVARSVLYPEEPEENNVSYTSVSQFSDYLKKLVKRIHTDKELKNLPITASADIREKFRVSMPKIAAAKQN